MGFFFLLYLPCCVIAEYPKEGSWAHTCVSRGMERGVFFCFVFVPAVLCHSRVPQGGEGLAYPHLCQPRDGEGWLFVCFVFVPAILCHGRIPRGQEELGPHLCQQRDREGWFLFLYLPRMRRAGPTPVLAEVCGFFCTSHVLSQQGTPRRRAGHTHTCVSRGMGFFLYLPCCVVTGYPN